MTEFPIPIHARAADKFSEVKEARTFVQVMAFGLSIVEDVRAGRVRTVQAYEAFHERATALVKSNDLNSGEYLFLQGVTLMVIDAWLSNS